MKTKQFLAGLLAAAMLSTSAASALAAVPMPDEYRDIFNQAEDLQVDEDFAEPSYLLGVRKIYSQLPWVRDEHTGEPLFEERVELGFFVEGDNVQTIDIATVDVAENKETVAIKGIEPRESGEYLAFLPREVTGRPTTVRLIVNMKNGEKKVVQAFINPIVLEDGIAYCTNMH